MSDLVHKILLTTDGSENAALAVRAAADLSSRGGAELHLPVDALVVVRYRMPGQDLPLSTTRFWAV